MKTPTMTKSHFQFIADTIAAMPDHAATLRAQKVSTAHQFADKLPATNPKFNREIFLAACKLPVEG